MSFSRWISKTFFLTISLGRGRGGRGGDDDGEGGGGGTDPMMMLLLGQSAAQGIQNGITSANDTNERNKREEREAEARRRASYYNYT